MKEKPTVDQWKALAAKQLRSRTLEELTWDSPEGITIPPLFIQNDLEGLEHLGGLPWDGLDNIVKWSPTSHLAEANTPTLVVHGEQDYRVVVTQGLELYGILKAKGVEARLVYYPDEGHWILKPQNSLHWYGEFLGWLERWLRR